MLQVLLDLLWLLVDLRVLVDFDRETTLILAITVPLAQY
jgi:hypothetical protein